MSHRPAQRVYQDLSPEQLWQLDGRSMLMDVQGGEFLLDDSVIDVNPPPFASRIPKPSANAHPKPVDDRTTHLAHPRPSMLPITSKTIERGPQTARRLRINSDKYANKTPVQLSILLPETAVPEHTIVRGSGAAPSHSGTQQAISPPGVSSPVPRDSIVVPPALPDFTFAHKRKPSTTKPANPPTQPKSIRKRAKSTNPIQPLRHLESDGAGAGSRQHQSARLSEFALPELSNPPVPFSREPEAVYESEGAPPTVPLMTVGQPAAMEWEAHRGNHSIDLRIDQEDIFVDEDPVPERSRRLSTIAPTLHPKELQSAGAEVLYAQEDGQLTFESLQPRPLRSSIGVPLARHVDADWEMEPLTELPEPKNRSVTRSRRSSVAGPLLPPIDLETVELPVPSREMEMREPELVEEPPVQPRRSSTRVPQPPELVAVEKEQVKQKPAPPPRPVSLLTALPPSASATASDTLTRPKRKPSTRPSVAPTPKERREPRAPVRGRDQQVKAAAPRPKRASEMSKAPLRPLTQVDAPRCPQSPQKRTAPTPVLEPISCPTSKSAINSSTGVIMPVKPKVASRVAARPSTRMTTTTAENTIPTASRPQLFPGPAAPSRTTLLPAPVLEHVIIPRSRTPIEATSATSNISVTAFSTVLRPSPESERVPDDMFERRKRDNYIAKPVGLDLTDHSTRGRGLDAVGSTSVNMSLNHTDPDITLSTSMPGEWVENSSVIIKRHERSRSVSRLTPSPVLAKRLEPQRTVESESGEDEDSEDTEVGEVLEPKKIKGFTLSRQPDLTTEDLERVPSSVSPVKRKPVSTLHSRSRSISKPPSRAPSRPPIEICAPPPRAVSARSPFTTRLLPRSRSGERAEPARSTSQARSTSNPPHVKLASTAARASDEGLGTKLAHFGEMLLNVVSSGLSFPSMNTSGETVRHPDLRLSELSPGKWASSKTSRKAIRPERGRPASREQRGRPVTRAVKGKPVSQNVIPPTGILKKPSSNEAHVPRPAQAPKRATLHPVARVPPKSSKSSGTREAVAVASRPISKKPPSQTRPAQKKLEHPTSARPRPPSQQRSRSRSTSISLACAMDVEMERESDVDISLVDAYEAKMFPSRVVEPSFANIAQSSPARPRRSNSRKRTLDAEINHAEQDRRVKRMRVDNGYAPPKLHARGPNREPGAPVKSRSQSRCQSTQRYERERSPVQPRARSRSNSRPRMEEIVPRGYLDLYCDEEIQGVLMDIDQGEVEEDVFGSVLVNSSRPNSAIGSRAPPKVQTFPRNPSPNRPLLPSPKANARKARRNTAAPKCRLTVPRSPRFSETHKQRALRGIAREKERKERIKQELKRKEEEKRLEVECWQRPPSPPALLREPKVTVPQTFTFQSDIRAEHRKEFEEKRKLWEARSSTLGASTSSQGSHPLRNQVHPSTAPKLLTEARAAQRRDFDDAIRQKEAELERLRAERARQLEREETEWRKQERRRLDQNARANPIPEWYQNAPRREITKA